MAEAVAPGYITWCLDDLIQELMMALVGYTGDIFVDNSSNVDPSCTEVEHPEHCTIGLAPDVVLADDVNREEITRLLQLAFHFKQIKKFMQQEQYPADGHKSKYRCALCSGLDEVLCLFEDEVVLLQDKLLHHGLDKKGLPGITYELADLQRLLSHLHYLVYELRRKSSHTLQAEGSSGGSTSGYDSKYLGLGALDSEGLQGAGLVMAPRFCGAQLLQWLHDRKGHGEQLLRTVTLRLMWHVHQVFFNQLTHWMVHGLLLNGGSEFLIRPSPDLVDSKAAEVPPAAEADTDTMRDSSSGSGRPMGVGTDALDVALMTEADTYRDFHQAFNVDNLQRPPGVSTHTAESIQFVGRAVRLLKSAPASAKLRQMQDSCGGHTPQQLLPYGDAMAYAAALRMLQEQAEFNPGALERTVEAIRADVASRVWQLVVVDSQLVEHLAALKDYMLLAKGDFYQCFLTDAAQLLAKPVQKTVQKDVVPPWLSAAGKSTASDDPCFKYFSLSIDRAAGQQRKEAMRIEAAKINSNSSYKDTAVPKTLATVTGVEAQLCDCLCLDAQLPWPLGVLIKQEDLDSYNRLFRLLLQVKRVQLDLEGAWQELGRLCGRKDGRVQPSDIGDLLQLRQHMGHLTDNLQVYLQLDVVESNFDLLLQQVEAAQDFNEVRSAHERFLTALKHQSLAHPPTLHGYMNLAMELSRRLSSLVKGACDNGLDLEQVQDVKTAFEAAATQLYMVMKSPTLRAQNNAPYLSQLYERLNYNGFCGKYLTPTTGKVTVPKGRT